MTTKNHERCYTCDLEVNGYVELMNHRKELHPSNKKFGNLDDRKCQFGNRCWYVHEKEIMDTGESKEPEPGKFECYICGDVSKTRDELKKHRKKAHTTQVKICEKFLAGTCIRNNDVCWYKHIHKDNNHPQNEQSGHQIFPPNQPQALPPDGLTQMTEALEGPINKTKIVN